MMSDGSRSLVNWMRWKARPSERASACDRVVLPTPGTSSISTCPRARMQTVAKRITSRLPRMTRATFASSRWIGSAAPAPLRFASTRIGSITLRLRCRAAVRCRGAPQLPIQRYCARSAAGTLRRTSTRKPSPGAIVDVFQHLPGPDLPARRETGRVDPDPPVPPALPRRVDLVHVERDPAAAPPGLSPAGSSRRTARSSATSCCQPRRRRTDRLPGPAPAGPRSRPARPRTAPGPRRCPRRSGRRPGIRDRSPRLRGGPASAGASGLGFALPGSR